MSASDDETVLVSQTASIVLNKTLAGNADEDGSGGVSLDDTLTFQFTATNTGNVTLTGVLVSDPLPGLGALVCTPAQPAVLFPGESTTCTADYVVTQADVDAAGFSNTATVDALDPGGNPVSDDDTVVTPIEGNPSITIDKYLLSNADEDGTGDISLGDTLTYQFDVENTGDVSLTNVSVTDPLPGLGAISCTPAQGATLNPTETMTCTADYVVTAANTAAGQIDNTATVVGLAPAGTPTSDSDTETVFTASADLSLSEDGLRTCPERRRHRCLHDCRDQRGCGHGNERSGDRYLCPVASPTRPVPSPEATPKTTPHFPPSGGRSTRWLPERRSI